MVRTRGSNCIVRAVLVVVLSGTILSPAYAQDTNPPELVSVSIVPTSVDVSGGPASATVTMQIVDDLSGFDYGYFRIYAPNSGQWVHVTMYPSNLVDPVNNRYEMTAQFPQFCDAGTWSLGLVLLRDKTTNQRTYSQADLDALGLSTTIDVISIEDTIGPELVSVILAPTEIDVSAGDGIVTLTATITDDVSGFQRAVAYLYSPSGNQYRAGNLSASQLIGPDTYRNTITVPQYSEAGDWTIRLVNLYDRANNQRSINVTQLPPINSVSVTSVPQDILTPEIQGFGSTPMVINTILSPDSTTFSLHITDNLSGFSNGGFRIESPSGGQGHYLSFSALPTYLKSGDTNDGIYEITKEFPRYSEYGEWKVAYLLLIDRTGNRIVIYEPQLTAMGLPITLFMEGAIPGGSASYIVPAGGGIVQTDDAGLTIEFPEGALSEDTEVSVTQVGRADEVDIYVGKNARGNSVLEYIFEPDGLVFGEPVTVVLRVDATGQTDRWRSSLGLYVNTDTDGDGVEDTFMPVPYVLTTETYPDGTEIMVFTAELEHFSDYAVVEEIEDASDATPPDVAMIVPGVGDSVQDGVTFVAEVTDESSVDGASFTIREADGGDGTDIGYEAIPAAPSGGTDQWTLFFDSTQLLDGNYVVFATATDEYGNEGTSDVVPFTVRNWAVLDLLPASSEFRAGRTIPVKFSLKVDAAVDPDTPFIRNENLEVRIYRTSQPGVILQTSHFGDRSTDYRISSSDEIYITNFKTSKIPAVYTVEIWRSAKDFQIASFTFETAE